MAAWHQRKYEPFAASVLPERHRPVTLPTGRLGQDRVTVESTFAEDVGISDASGYIGGRCCSHRLSLPPCTLLRNRHEVSVCRRESDRAPAHAVVPDPGRESERLLRVAPMTSQCPSDCQHGAACKDAAAPSADDGAVKLWRALLALGVACGRHRVARLRRVHGLEARRTRRFRMVVEQHQFAPPARQRKVWARFSPRIWFITNTSRRRNKTIWRRVSKDKSVLTKQIP